MVKTNEQVKMYMMRVSYTNIFVLVVILISLLDGISPVFSLYEYKPGKYDNGHPYIQATPSHVFYRDDNIYYNDTVGLSEDFQFDKIKPLYLEELNQGIISTSELYEKAHWNIDVSIVQKNSGGGGGVPCPPTLPYCNIPTGTSSYTLLTDESDEEQLYKLYVIHNSLGAPSGTTYLRIITYSSSTYGITAIELSTTITNITNFVRLNRNKLLIIAIALRLNDTAEDNHIEATLSVTLSYGSTVLYNSSKSMIYKNKAWAILHTYLWIPDSINENADFSSLTIRTLITTNQYLENMKIDFDFVNLYLATISSFLLVFPLSRTMLIKSLITYTADVERNWYNPDGAYEYGTALASLANKIKSLLDHKEYILITLGRAYVIRLIELPRVLYSDNNEKRIFIPISTIIIIRTNVSSEQLSTTSEQSNSKNIKYIQITEGDVEFNDPLSNVNVKPSLRLEYPAITMMSIESQRLNVQYGNKVYTTGVKWGSPASSGSYDKHAYKSIIHNSSAEILDYKVYTDVTNYEEASNIGTSLSVASFLLGLVLSIICPPASALEWTIFIASYTSGLVSIVYDIAGGKHTIVVTRTISYGDIFTAGNTGYAKATIYVSYPSISDGIDNLIRFFGSERHSLAFLESKYEDVITDKDSKYFLFDVTQYRWYHTYSIPYDLFRDNPSLQLAIFGLEKIHISYTLFLSIVEHSIDGQSHYLRINGAEKIVYQQVEIYRLLGARYGWNS